MQTLLLTSLAEIKAFNPCKEGWLRVLSLQNKTEADSVEFSLASCLDSCTIGDVLWLIGKRKVEIQIAVEFAKWCADSVAHLKNASDSAAVYAADSASASAADSASASAADSAAVYAADSAAASAASAADSAAVYAAKGRLAQKAKLKELILNYGNKE